MVVARNPNEPEEYLSDELKKKMEDLEKEFANNGGHLPIKDSLDLMQLKKTYPHPVYVTNKKTKWDYFVLYSGWIIALILGFINFYDRFM